MAGLESYNRGLHWCYRAGCSSQLTSSLLSNEHRDSDMIVHAGKRRLTESVSNYGHIHTSHWLNVARSRHSPDVSAPSPQLSCLIISQRPWCFSSFAVPNDDNMSLNNQPRRVRIHPAGSRKRLCIVPSDLLLPTQRRVNFAGQDIGCRTKLIQVLILRSRTGI